MAGENDIEQWVKKVKREGVDLSLEEDLSIGIMNLVSLEEHLFFSAMKTGSDRYLPLLAKTREMRKQAMKKIVLNPEGEEWCISKHLLAAAMRLYEVGTRELANENRQSAKNYFNAAFELYSLFFAINLKLIDLEEGKSQKQAVAARKPSEPRPGLEINHQNQGGIIAAATGFLKKAVDCCKE